ncbi:MAG: D-2-hydroxyacid dehydrogenase [Moraxella sp.]|nr:D-2-hydroxyacid dehydrogenase [Moraxella sp.]
MKAVFLDQATFSCEVRLTTPDGVREFICFDSTPNNPDIIAERTHDADIIIVNKVIIGRDVIARLPKLKLIQLTATGMDNVDKSACDEFGVLLYNVVGYSTDSVPEHTFMLMLSAMRAVKTYHTQATDGTWQASGKFCLLDTPILDLAGKTLGIIGKGAIGQKVGRIATAFGMTVLYAERQGKPPRDDSHTAFDDVLARSDVISLNCPLTADTHHLINDATIAKMTKRPLIINVARGAVVDSHAIVQALADDKILGYATDVLEQEPPTDEPLFALKDHPRVLITPHNAWGSLNAQQRMWDIVCHQVSDFIKK